MPQQRQYNQLDLSGAVQRATSHLLRKGNEVVDSRNAAYNIRIGSAVRRPGYEKVGRTIEHGNDSLGATVYKYDQNNKIVVGINNSTNTNATLRYLDTADYWTTILSNAAANTRFQMTTLGGLDQLFVAGKSDNEVYLPLTNIDSTLTASTTRNVYTAPKAAFIAPFNGGMLAMNVEVNGKKYGERMYPSSPAIGPITFVQTDQKGLLKQLRIDATTYLKVGMSLDIYGAGTEAKKVSGLTIVSVDKKNKRFSFADATIDVADNDEIWLSGTKGKLNIFWNVDDPNTEDAEYFETKNGRPITGWTGNNNRLLVFTDSSFTKLDGANVITISEEIGCVSHETIQNIGSWTIWLHTSGVWAYNDNTGDLKLLSKAIEPYVRSINQANFRFASGGVVGRTYKLAVGELLPIESVTTSTSTSSTSTSSTSSSTSSTSTSSTSTSSTSSSTSSTSTSTSLTTTSTSSTSFSTSSTSFSTSSTSTSMSTSTSSTTTTTAISTKKVVRFVYDFDMNAWWLEEHKREIRFQFNHTMHGYTKPYFTDDTGRLFRDETGNTDNGDSIPVEIEVGRDNFGSNLRKQYSTVISDSENARGAIIQYATDGGQHVTLGQITRPVQVFDYPQGNQAIEGRDINYKITHNDKGAPPYFNGLGSYYSVTESIPNAGQQ